MTGHDQHVVTQIQLDETIGHYGLAPPNVFAGNGSTERQRIPLTCKEEGFFPLAAAPAQTYRSAWLPSLFFLDWFRSNKQLAKLACLMAVASFSNLLFGRQLLIALSGRCIAHMDPDQAEHRSAAHLSSNYQLPTRPCRSDIRYLSIFTIF